MAPQNKNKTDFPKEQQTVIQVKLNWFTEEKQVTHIVPVCVCVCPAVSSAKTKPVILHISYLKRHLVHLLRSHSLTPTETSWVEIRRKERKQRWNLTYTQRHTDTLTRSKANYNIPTHCLSLPPSDSHGKELRQSCWNQEVKSMMQELLRSRERNRKIEETLKQATPQTK